MTSSFSMWNRKKFDGLFHFFFLVWKTKVCGIPYLIHLCFLLLNKKDNIYCMGFECELLLLIFFVRNTLKKNREKTERRRKTEKKNFFDQQDSLVGWWLICGIIELIFWYCVFDTRFYNLIGGDFIWRYLQSNIVSNWIESFLNFFSSILLSFVVDYYS